MTDAQKPELIEEIRVDPAVYINNIRERKPFALARYNDGEICAMLGGEAWENRNCDHHEYLPEMCELLR